MKPIRMPVLILLCFLLPIASGQFGSKKDEPILIKIKCADYRLYMQDHPALDRLAIKDDWIFLLATPSEIHQLEKSGLSVYLQQPLTDGQATAALKSRDINGQFHNYLETENLLENLVERFPSLARLESVGRSLESRELYVLKISDRVTEEEGEPNVYVVGCHHAREWISVEVPLLFAQYLLEHYSDDPGVKSIVENSQIYILPIVNPDGLEFSIHTYRWWRKNRRYNGNFSWGVDLNRNYGFKWGYDDVGSSSNPSGEAYRGSGPFSEPETKALCDFMISHPPAGALFYHNFSQKIIYPWGYTSAPAPHQTEFEVLAAEMSHRIQAVSGRVYTYGAQILYPVNGDSCDWVYGTFAVPAFTIELPPDTYLNGGFFNAESDIASVFAENLPALLYFTDQVGN